MLNSVQNINLPRPKIKNDGKGLHVFFLMVTVLYKIL